VGEDADSIFYGLRRVDPCQGVVAVVGRPDARAISIDGVFRQIQTLAPWLGRPRARDGVADTVRYCRVGSWSWAGGLSRVPVNPTLDVGRMIAACGALVADLPHAESCLPFARADELGLRSLGQDSEPLALLATALPDTDLDSIKVRRCGPGGPVGRGERSFVSAPSSERDGGGRRRHVEAVKRCVMQAAGRPVGLQWFRMRVDEAVGLDSVDPVRFESAPLAGERLPRDAFPSLSVRFDRPADADRQRLDQYRTWLARCLFGLLGPKDRNCIGLEQAAAGHARLVDAIRRLYPPFLDLDLLKRIRF
jgi:hypothetical protein